MILFDFDMLDNCDIGMNVSIDSTETNDENEYNYDMRIVTHPRPKMYTGMAAGLRSIDEIREYEFQIDVKKMP